MEIRLLMRLHGLSQSILATSMDGEKEVETVEETPVPEVPEE